VTPREDRPAGPARDDLVRQSEDERNALGEQSSHQARPETERPARVASDERLDHSSAAAGMERSEEQNAPTEDASVRAFEQSRGSAEPREPQSRD
jgi:hypothetical protein